jgi:hypothetical protein
VPSAKWYVVARTTYRVRMSGVRWIRPYFLPLAAVLLAVWVGYLAPAMVGLMVDDLLTTFLSQAAVALMSVILFMFFLLLITMPISLALKEVQTAQLETFMSAPVRPGDLLLGEFMGMMPFYAIFITAVTGFFAAALGPLGLSLLQSVIIILVFAITLLSALWIGSVIAALVNTKLGRSAHGKDVGKALSTLIVIPPVAVIYAIIGGGFIASLADPGTSQAVSSWLVVLPSSWGAQVFALLVANPGDTGAVWGETLAWFGGLVAFFLVSLWGGAKVADRAYSLELASFSAPRAKPDGIFYSGVRRLGGGGSFATLLVSMFKEYTRRVENLSWAAYAVALFAMVALLLFEPDGPSDLIMPAAMLLPLLATAVASDVTLRGRDNLFICRKAPNGEGRYVKASLLKSWIVAVPIAAVLIATTTALIPSAEPLTVLAYTAYFAQLVAAQTAFALGLFLLVRVPSDNQKDKNMTLFVVFQVILFVSIGLFFASAQIVGGAGGLLFVHAPATWVVAVTVLLLGMGKLRRIE